MKTSTLLNLSVFCLQAVASLIPDHDPLAGREVTVPEWDVEVTPGGEKVTLRGTIEEVRAQLLERNPNWDEDFPEQVEDLAERDLGEESFTPIEKRTDFSGSKYFCYARWPTTARARIVEGISYLRRVKGKPSLRAGPGRCSRVSCSWNAAIYWCNDNKSTKTLKSFGSIADGAQFIINRCRRNIGGGIYTSGQVFHRTNWNVIVRNENSGC